MKIGYLWFQIPVAVTLIKHRHACYDGANVSTVYMVINGE